MYEVNNTTEYYILPIVVVKIQISGYLCKVRKKSKREVRPKFWETLDINIPSLSLSLPRVCK